MYYLAIDLGASSGRHILGHLENNKIILQEIYRFENGMVERNGRLCWDYDRIFREILAGMKRCAEMGIVPASVGIDTWGVDFVLLDADDRVLGDTVAYRDSRTQGVDAKVYERIPEAELYARTGIQKLPFNTIYQLYAVKLQEPELLERAARLLMVPEYLNFLLTGQKKNEYTDATTTQLVNAETKTWDAELLEKLGLPARIFGELNLPGTSVGFLRDDVKEEVGFDTEVVLPATHDTASAVLAVPTNDDDAMYISSGTWSLMGVERLTPDCGELSREKNFTNEGGYDYRFRFLKNIMGLWMIQSLRNELPTRYSFPQIAEMAESALDFPSIVDVNDSSFIAPPSMAAAIRDLCVATGQKVPETESELFACTYKSLAAYYAKTAREIEEITGRVYPRIHIIGGGSKDTLLNRLTSETSGKTVFAGPAEATAIGNILAQMLRAGHFSGLAAARQAVRESFGVEEN